MHLLIVSAHFYKDIAEAMEKNAEATLKHIPPVPVDPEKTGNGPSPG